MSLTGKATADELRGKINGLETIRGYSAYEIALIHGFEGTEEEWLASLKGEQGEKGDPAEGSVLYTEQTLTPEQQSKARENIGVKQQKVDIIYNVDTGEAEYGLPYAEIKSLLDQSTEIIAVLDLWYNDTAYRATTRTAYRDEDTHVYFDFAGLGVLMVSDENVWSFTEHTAGGSADGVSEEVIADVNNAYPFLQKEFITRQTINSGTFSTSYSRLANTKPMVFNNDVIIKCEPGYKFEVNFWSDATADKSAWLSCVGWLTENYKVSAGTYFSLLIAKTDNSTIQVDDYDKVKIYRAVDLVETEANTLELKNLAVELNSVIGDAKQSMTFSKGSWSVTSNGAGGTYVRRVTNATRFASDRGYVFSKDVKISMPDYSKGSAYIVIVTDTDTMTTVKQSGWLSKEYIVPANSPFVIEVKSLDSGYTVDNTLADLQMVCVDSLCDISQRMDILESGEEPSATETAKYKEFASLFNNSGVAEPFIYFTDPHYIAVGEDADWRPGYKEHLSVMKKHFDNTSAGFVLCGGDWLLSGNTKENACYMLSKIKAKMGEMFNKFYLVVGNHDTNYLGITESGAAANTGRLTQQAIYNLWYGEHGKSYYSFSGANTKFYVFDCGIDSGHIVLNDLDNEQIGYFVEQLKNNDDKYIALTTHIVATEAGTHPLTNRVTEIANTYNSRGTVTYNGVDYDFSQKTGKVEFLIAGHTHADLTGTLNSIPYIQTTNASVSANYPTFDYVFADYTARKLKTVRVGDGENREIDLV